MFWKDTEEPVALNSMNGSGRTTESGVHRLAWNEGVLRRYRERMETDPKRNGFWQQHHLQNYFLFSENISSSPGPLQTSCIKDDLELLIPLPLPPKHFDYKCALPHLISQNNFFFRLSLSYSAGHWTQELTHTRQILCHWNILPVLNLTFKTIDHFRNLETRLGLPPFSEEIFFSSPLCMCIIVPSRGAWVGE